MNLTSELYRQIDNPGISHTERVQLRCSLAKELEEAGNYETAREIMGGVWQRIGERPLLDGLDERTAAEVLMRVGTLSGWLGSAKQLAGAQETAKNLITESISVFEKLPDAAKVAEAQTELAYCYWREGAFDEARITLQEALARLSDETNSELKSLALTRIAVIDISTQRFNDGLRLLTEAAPLFEKITNQSLKGRFHVGLATILKNLGAAEKREDYTDRALVEYAAASYHFEQAGHTSYRAAVENNLGFLFLKAGKFDEADEHLDRARRLFTSLRDEVHTAQVDETRARALLAQGRNPEADRVVGSAVRTLEKGGEQALLAEALTTHGVALARLEEHEQARMTLERAMAVAEQAGDLEGAGRAALTLIEELKGQLAEDELREVYSRADGLLARTQHSETMARLRECARYVLEARPAGEATEVENFVYVAEATANLLRHAQRIAMTDGTVLLTGETGTGKEVLARLIHEWSGRPGRFVAINCAALTDRLIESQLFGHKKGSFTDAIQDYPGAVREAAGGTLLLDEVGELSKTNQGKLLRLIERGEIHPIGATAPERVNVRIITTTNSELKEQVAQGRFRDDLFYRLQTFHLNIPPLRERAEDIPALAAYFIAEARTRHHKRMTFAPSSLEAMQRLPFRGNVRELRGLIERAFLEAVDGAQISAEAVELLAIRQTRNAGLANAWEGCSLVEEVSLYEKTLIRRALEATQGGVTRAARLLGTTHQALIAILSTRHQDLLSARKPVQKRRKSIIRIPAEKDRKRRKG